MNKPAKPVAQPEDAFEMSEAACDAQFNAWVECNRDGFEASLDEARAQIDRGECDERSFAEIIAEGIQRLGLKP